MTINYEAVKMTHRLLASLYEMQDVEAMIATVAAETKDRAIDEMSKKIFAKWAHESASQFKRVQQVIDVIHGETKTVGEQCHDCIEDITGWSLVSKYARKYILDTTPGKDPLPIRDLYQLVRKNLELKGDAASKYSKLAQFTSNQQAKDILMQLSSVEKEHHAEAQLLVETLERIYGPTLKPSDGASNDSAPTRTNQKSVY